MSTFIGYFVFMGILHTIVFLIIAVGGIVFLLKNRERYGEFIRSVALFLYLLLVVGACFSAVWSTVIHSHLYVSMDHLFDFIPFFPITQSVINQTWGNQVGYLIGETTIFELQVIWAVFAIATWGLTIIGYRKIWALWKNKNFQKDS